MSERGGPWGREEPETPPERPRPTPRLRLPGHRRVWLWLAVLAAVAALVAALTYAFPEAVRSRDDWANVAFAVGLLLLLSTRLLNRPRGPTRQALRHAGIWAAIVGVLMLVLAFHDELAGLPQRLRLALSSGDPVQTAEHELTVPQDPEAGGFVVVGAVNGQRVSFLVDTGSTDTVLAPQDAQRIGVDLGRLDFAGQVETANGVGHGAPLVADLQVGPIALHRFRMGINQAPMSRSLLGMSFLSRMDSVEVRGGKLVLRWRDAALKAP